MSQHQASLLLLFCAQVALLQWRMCTGCVHGKRTGRGAGGPPESACQSWPHPSGFRSVSVSNTVPPAFVMASIFSDVPVACMRV